MWNFRILPLYLVLLFNFASQALGMQESEYQLAKQGMVAGQVYWTNPVPVSIVRKNNHDAGRIYWTFLRNKSKESQCSKNPLDRSYRFNLWGNKVGCPTTFLNKFLYYIVMTWTKNCSKHHNRLLHFHHNISHFSLFLCKIILSACICNVCNNK